MKKVLLPLIILATFTFPIFCQTTAKVRLEQGVSAEEKRIQEIENQIYPLEKELWKLEGSLNLTSVISKRHFSNFTDEARINSEIKRNQEILDKINSNPRLYSLANKINSLYKGINKTSREGKTVRDIEKVARENIRNGNLRLNELNGKKVEKDNEEDKDVAHESLMAELDRELQLEEQQLLVEKREIEQLVNENKVGSIDDFLSENAKPATADDFDFLAEENNSDSGMEDFLAEDDSKADILNDKAAKNTEFKIDLQGNNHGVIDGNGKILIPYRDWEIKEYKDGIAKVSIEVESFECNGNNRAFKQGFVDASGEFLDGYSVDFESYSYIDVNYPVYLKLETIHSYDETNEQRSARERKEARQKRENKRREEEKERKARAKRIRCEKEVASWKKRIINQYR